MPKVLIGGFLLAGMSLIWACDAPNASIAPLRAENTVYDETLRWSDGSQGTSLDPSVGSPHFEGSFSLGITYEDPSSFAAFHSPGLSMSPYTKIEFAMNAPANPSLQLMLHDSAGVAGPTVSLDAYKSPSIGGWSLVSVPLIDLEMSGKTVTRVTIQENSGSPRPTYYIDDLRFTASAVATPTPTVVSTPSPTPSSTPVPNQTPTPQSTAAPPTPETKSWLMSFGERGTYAGALNIPRGVAVSPNGEVFVADTFNQRIQVFNAGGQYLRQWDTSGRVWDLTVDSQGNVYGLVPNATDSVHKYSSDGDLLGSWESGMGEFAYPTGIDVDGADNIYVANTFEDRVEKYTDDGEFIGAFGGTGTGDGRFSELRSVAVDDDGYIYALDSGNSRVQKLAPDGSYITQWGSFGHEDGQFNFPTDIDTDATGHVVVADYENHRIQLFTTAGEFVKSYSAFGYANGRLRFPRSLAVTPNGTIYVANSNSDRIDVWGIEVAPYDEAPPPPTPPPTPTPPAYYEGQWGEAGEEGGQFNFPRGVAVGQDGLIYVADTFNDRIQVFEPDGTFVRQFPTGVWRAWGVAVIATEVDQAVYVAAPDSNRIEKFSLTGEPLLTLDGTEGGGEFAKPFDVAVDSVGDLYVSDTFNDRVQKFDKAGAFLQTFGSSGSGPGEFSAVRSVAVGPDDHVYVLDSGNHRVQELSPDGTFLRQFASPVSGSEEAEFSTSIAVDGQKNVYVADYASHEVHKFTSSGDLIKTFGGFGFHAGELRYARGITVAPDGTLYVADALNDRIQVFR